MPLPPRLCRQRCYIYLPTSCAEDLFLYSAALSFYGLISVAPLGVVALWVTSLLVGPTQIGRPRTASISLLSVMYVAYLRVGANFERRYASDALAAVVLLGLWLFAANTALLIGYRAAHRRRSATAVGTTTGERRGPLT